MCFVFASNYLQYKHTFSVSDRHTRHTHTLTHTMQQICAFISCVVFWLFPQTKRQYVHLVCAASEYWPVSIAAVIESNAIAIELQRKSINDLKIPPYCCIAVLWLYVCVQHLQPYVHVCMYTCLFTL